MTAAIQVRPATTEDHSDVRAMFARAFPPMERLLFSTAGRTSVALADDQVVGASVLRLISIGSRRVGVVEWIFADPAADTPGVGSALADEASTWFRQMDCDEQVARIEPLNTASQELHRRRGFVPMAFRAQVRRWRWRLPELWGRVHAGFDPGLRLWVRTTDGSLTRRPATVSRLVGTASLNAVLLLLVVWRSPRDLALDLAGVAWVVAIAVGLLGLRELVLRLVARLVGLRLGHVPWVSGVGVGVLLAVAVGVWFPLTGSSVPDDGPWRYREELPRLAKAHLAAGMAVALMAWVTVVAPAGPGWLPMADITRAAVMLALLDLVVPTSPMLGSSARVVYDWSRRAWLGLALLGLSPFVLTMIAR